MERPKHVVGYTYRRRRREKKAYYGGHGRFMSVAAACGYRYCTTVEGVVTLQGELGKLRTKKGPVFLEVKCAIGARDDIDAMR